MYLISKVRILAANPNHKTNNYIQGGTEVNFSVRNQHAKCEKFEEYTNEMSN